MSQPFKRALAMFAAIRAAMLLQGTAQSAAMNGIGSYVSRGKGKGRLPSPSFGRARSKYEPHIGAKEQAKHAGK